MAWRWIITPVGINGQGHRHWDIAASLAESWRFLVEESGRRSEGVRMEMMTRIAQTVAVLDVQRVQ